MPELWSRVGDLVDSAAARLEHAGSAPAVAAIGEVRARLHEPLRVALAGSAKAGKSTLLNALVGELVAPTGTTECTKVVTWYREGLYYRARLEPADGGPAVEVPLTRDSNGVEIGLGGRAPEDVERIVVEWPASVLRSMTLIDTPGVGSLSGLGRRAVELLAPSVERAAAADAVLYLTPHIHGADARFLEAFHDDGAAAATPVNAIGVLSRADEIGGARSDAMIVARRVADRYRREPSLRPLCQTVVPVAGLLAQGAAALTEAEFRAFVALAEFGDDGAEALMVSAGRFATSEVDGLRLFPEERLTLLDRFGLFGVRLGRDLVRHGGCDTSRSLAEQLRRRSGLDDLRALLADRFTARRNVLKARSALLALDDILRRWPLGGDDGAQLEAEIERVQATAHELAELRVLLAVRAGAVPLHEGESAELERLLASGGSAAERLGLPADEAGVGDALVDAIARWRAIALHPLASPAVVEASDVAVRTLEGLAATG